MTGIDELIKRSLVHGLILVLTVVTALPIALWLHVIFIRLAVETVIRDCRVQIMKLVSLKEYAENYYTASSRPSIQRLRRLASRGDIPAVRQGNRWFVDIDKIEHDDVDALVEKILRS